MATSNIRLMHKVTCSCCLLQVLDNGVHSIVVSSVLKGTPCLVAGLPRQVKALSEQLKSSMQPNAPTEYLMDLFVTSDNSYPFRFARFQLLLVTNAPLKNFMVCLLHSLVAVIP